MAVMWHEVERAGVFHFQHLALVLARALRKHRTCKLGYGKRHHIQRERCKREEGYNWNEIRHAIKIEAVRTDLMLMRILARHEPVEHAEPEFAYDAKS